MPNAKKVAIEFPDGAWKIIQNLKRPKESDSKVITNLIMAYLKEKNYTKRNTNN